MPQIHSRVAAADRVALLRNGIVVVGALPSRCIAVTGAQEERVREIVGRQFGDQVEAEWLGDLPRRLEPRRRSAYMERERGRLQLRLVLRGDEHVDEIVVAEDDRTVVVFATVCTSAGSEAGSSCEAPWHVYLERPLGGRQVIDGTCGVPVPYKNVYATLGGTPRT